MKRVLGKVFYFIWLVFFFLGVLFTAKTGATISALKPNMILLAGNQISCSQAGIISFGLVSVSAPMRYMDLAALSTAYFVSADTSATIKVQWGFALVSECFGRQDPIQPPVPNLFQGYNTPAPSRVSSFFHIQHHVRDV